MQKFPPWVSVLKIFFTDKNFEPLTDSDVSAALTATIRSELDQRNEEEGQEYKLRKMKVWN